MSQLIENTIEAYGLFMEGELTLDEIELGVEQGLISESLFLSLNETLFTEAEAEPEKALTPEEKIGLLSKLKKGAHETYTNVEDSVKHGLGKLGNSADKRIDEIKAAAKGVADWSKEHAQELKGAGVVAGLGAAAAGAGYGIHKYLKARKAAKQAAALANASKRK